MCYRAIIQSFVFFTVLNGIIFLNVGLAQDFWWASDYPLFLLAVKNAPKQMLKTSYETGPGGRAKVDLCVKRDQRWGLILEAKLPREAMVSIDPKTGERLPAENAPVITIRDHDLDTVPDSFKMEPSGQPLYEESFTKDGYTKYRHDQDHRAILIQWIVGIGYSINHFLYGVDSAMPR